MKNKNMLKPIRFCLILISAGLFFFVTAQAASMYNESPNLRSKVQSGDIPKVDDRLPNNPMVIQPVDKIGKYGGTWHLGMKRKRDQALFTRYLGYENLVRWDSRWIKVIPNVAQSFSSNKNSTKYTFKLRRNMRWSDGHLFTADDILFWYEDILLNKKLTPKYPNTLVVDGELVRVKKLDNYTVEFHFSSPYGLFPQVLAHPISVDATTYPKHHLKRFLPKYNPQLDQLVQKEGVRDWVELFNKKFGTPTIIDRPSRWQNPGTPTLNAWIQQTPYSSDTDKVVFKRNPFYWKVDTMGNQLPYIDQVECHVTETAEQVAGLALAGKIDMQRRRMDARPRSEFEKSMKQQQFTFFETLPAFSNTMVIALNLTHQNREKRKIYQNKHFRIALSHAIDRNSIIGQIPGMEGKPYQPSPRPETPFYDEAFSTQYTEYNPNLSNQLLDNAGLARKNKRGFRLDSAGKPIHIEIEYNDFVSGWYPTLKLLSKNWAAIGISVSLKKYTRDVLYERKHANLHDAIVWLGDGGMPVVLEPRWYFPFSNESNYAQLWQRYYNKVAGGEVPPSAVKTQMELYDQIKATADQTEQFRLMQKILTIAKEQFYVIGISLPGASFGIVKDYFHNVPQVMPYGWIYPTPAPTNTCQFFID